MNPTIKKNTIRIELFLKRKGAKTIANNLLVFILLLSEACSATNYMIIQFPGDEEEYLLSIHINGRFPGFLEVGYNSSGGRRLSQMASAIAIFTSEHTMPDTSNLPPNLSKLANEGFTSSAERTVHFKVITQEQYQQRLLSQRLAEIHTHRDYEYWLNTLTLFPNIRRWNGIKTTCLFSFLFDCCQMPLVGMVEPGPLWSLLANKFRVTFQLPIESSTESFDHAELIHPVVSYLFPLLIRFQESHFGSYHLLSFDTVRNRAVYEMTVYSFYSGYPEELNQEGVIIEPVYEASHEEPPPETRYLSLSDTRYNVPGHSRGNRSGSTSTTTEPPVHQSIPLEVLRRGPQVQRMQSLPESF